MKLISFQLKNYKSFYDSGELRFADGFNVIVGQNNAGKSALLQGISFRFGNKPHRSLKTKPTSTTAIAPLSEALFSVECTGQELREVLLTSQGQFLVPVHPGSSPEHFALAKLNELFSRPQIVISLRRDGGNNIWVTKLTSFGDYVFDQKAVMMQSSDDRQNFRTVGQGGAEDLSRDLGIHVSHAFINQVYFFHAERLKVAEIAFGKNDVLNPDASNLPEVLNILQANKERFNRFNSYVNQIFPTIRWVAVRPNRETGALQIIIWTVDPSTEREDLAISLDDAGTGVGQVLAILYVAVMSSFARSIVIDEPNSFLHPGAAKKLMEILRGFTYLQFIISTHSPEILRAAQPKTLSIIRWSAGISSVDQMETDKMDSLQLVLREVGTSLSDVFGADQVLWVEGPTEEVCFRILIEQYLKRPLTGTAIAAVRDIGRLVNRRPSAALVWEIYTKLSGAGALMPPALAFSFDREGRTPQDMEDIRRQSGGRVHFLPRRIFENYLIDADAIASVLSEGTGTREDITTEAVHNWIEKYMDAFLPDEFKSERTESIRLREINGAGLLDRLFAEVSNNKVFFNKVHHGFKLVEWLIKRKPDYLEELGDYLERIMASAP